jgi:hypothetical protein
MVGKLAVNLLRFWGPGKAFAVSFVKIISLDIVLG